MNTCCYYYCYYSCIIAKARSGSTFVCFHFSDRHRNYCEYSHRCKLDSRANLLQPVFGIPEQTLQVKTFILSFLNFWLGKFNKYFYEEITLCCYNIIPCTATVLHWTWKHSHRKLHYRVLVFFNIYSHLFKQKYSK